MDFLCELVETKQTKSRDRSSPDNVYRVSFVTDNPMIMDLGKLPPDTLFKIKVEIDNE